MHIIVLGGEADTRFALGVDVIHVRRRVHRYDEFGPPKSDAGTRDILISDSTAAMLKAWRRVAPKDEHGMVFPNGGENIEGHANLLHRVFWPAQMTGVTAAASEKNKDGKPILDANTAFIALRYAAAALFIEQAKKVQRSWGTHHLR
ncbi:hypothetical protein NKI38_33100 [Mesorhizobium sp. M0621]|uniref:hypothetical protein n=1 Tax=Mesorhizobium sp. M0621 TaxID=2956974 RepID=UPI0033384848